MLRRRECPFIYLQGDDELSPLEVMTGQSNVSRGLSSLAAKRSIAQEEEAAAPRGQR